MPSTGVVRATSPRPLRWRASVFALPFEKVGGMSTAVAKADRCVRPLKADSVSPLPRQEADPRRGGLAGQGQLSATLGKLRYRPLAGALDRPVQSPCSGSLL